MDKGIYTTYWANTSSNSLVGKLLREGNRRIKEKFEILLRGESIQSEIDEQIVYNQLDGNERAVFSLLLASGYLKVVFVESYRDIPEGTNPKYELALTNLEVRLMFGTMIRDWFSAAEADDAIILEFKVRDFDDEATLKETVQSALEQIEKKQYAAQLIASGIPKEHIRSYGFAFEGKKVLIG